MGVANYGQMTAGGWMYIGPQGIVHGTFNTLLNAGRLVLGIPKDQDLAGRLYVTSGLGGMSGAQGKAAEIAGAVALVAEVDMSRIETRYSQGWVSKVTDSLPEALAMAREKLAAKEPCAIAYHGNVVDLLEYLYDHECARWICCPTRPPATCPTTAATAPRASPLPSAPEMLAEDPAGFARRWWIKSLAASL